LHSNGCWLRAVNELESTVSAHSFYGRSGALDPVQWVPLLSGACRGNSRAAGIGVDGGGRILCAGNRGCDTIGVFAIDVDPRQGMLDAASAVMACGSPVCRVFEP
jgi:6-phosphogluconolactonase